MPTLPSDVLEFLAGLDPVQRSAAESLVEIVMAADQSFEAAMKWKRPTFTVNGNWHHWVCAVQPAKARESLEFHTGVLPEDPNSVLAGDGRSLRRFTVPDGQEFDPRLIGPLVIDAIEKQTDMLE